MTYYDLIRQCLLEESAKVRIDPALAERVVRIVIKAFVSRAGPSPENEAEA